MNHLKAYVGKRTNHYIGKKIIEQYSWWAEDNRRKTIEETCVGERNTEDHKILSNFFIDFMEGKITEERFIEVKELYKHLL